MLPGMLTAVLSATSVGQLVEQGDQAAAQGHHGQAALAYERANVVDPRYPGLETRLAPRDESLAQHALSRLSTDEWARLMFFALALACIGLVTLGWTERRRVSRPLVISGLTVAIAAGAVGVLVAPSTSDAVMLNPAVARIAPFERAEEAFAAAEGARVRIERERGDWAAIRVGAQTGWVPLRDVQRVVAPRG